MTRCPGLWLGQLLDGATSKTALAQWHARCSQVQAANTGYSARSCRAEEGERYGMFFRVTLVGAGDGCVGREGVRPNHQQAAAVQYRKSARRAARSMQQARSFIGAALLQSGIGCCKRGSWQLQQTRAT